MHVSVTVGGVIVGAFHNKRTALKRCVSKLAPGCGARIKKCRHTGGSMTAKCRSNEARQTTNRVGDYKRYPRMLKPGEFQV